MTGKKRDRYQSSFDEGFPGTRAATYDIGLALYFLQRFVKECTWTYKKFPYLKGDPQSFGSG